MNFGQPGVELAGSPTGGDARRSTNKKADDPNRIARQNPNAWSSLPAVVMFAVFEMFAMLEALVAFEALSAPVRPAMVVASVHDRAGIHIRARVKVRPLDYHRRAIHIGTNRMHVHRSTNGHPD